MTTALDVSLPAGWFPLGPVPGALLAAAAAGRDGRAVATMVICVHHCPGLTSDADAISVFEAVPTTATTDISARALRQVGAELVAVLDACAAPGVPVTAADLGAALDQTVVYAVDSTGNAMRSSSADDANDAWCGSTRTV